MLQMRLVRNQGHWSAFKGHVTEPAAQVRAVASVINGLPPVPHPTGCGFAQVTGNGYREIALLEYGSAGEVLSGMRRITGLDWLPVR